MAKKGSHIISGIDIGNSQVKVIIARVRGEDLKPEILGAGTAPSNGLRNGMIVDMEEAINNVRSAIERAEVMAAEKISRAYLAISGTHVGTQISRGVIAVSRADNEISQSDKDRVIKAASVVSLSPNREIIDILPRNFVIDGAEYVKNPVGMKGVRLEADVLIIHGLSPHLRNLIKCVEENDVHVAGLVYAPIASSLAVLDRNQKEYGVVNLDFGGETTAISIFEEGEMLHSAILPIGSNHITKDLAVFLRTQMDIAERIKIEHCSTSYVQDMRRKSEVDLTPFTGDENLKIQKTQLIRVVDARVQELFDFVNEEVKKAPKAGILPAGVVINGGGANLPGLLEVAKEKMRLPVKIAKPIHFDGISEIVDDSSYSVSLGLILWGINREFESGAKIGRANSFSTGGGLLKKMSSWLKNFLP